jgi:hypothetical protein
MINATIEVPTKVADQYNHRFPNTPCANLCEIFGEIIRKEDLSYIPNV